jgi:Tetracyclin repressor-like, C-terminal domain
MCRAGCPGLVAEDPAKHERLAAELDALPAERFPTLKALAHAMATKDPDHYFDNALDVIVLGLRGLAAQNGALTG